MVIEGRAQRILQNAHWTFCLWTSRASEVLRVLNALSALAQNATFSHLFHLLGAETNVLKKAPLESAFGSAQNAIFWKKLRFGPRLRTRKTYGALEVHKQKVQCAFCSIRWALPSITKLPLIKSSQFSRLSELIPLISFLCSPNKFPNPNIKKSITNSQNN